MKIAMYSAITRPRICGAVVICTNALAAVMTVRAANPHSGSMRANVRYDRHQPGDQHDHPEGDGGADDEALAGLRRRAASSDPASDPMARIEPSRPYSPAPLP